jgi:N6-adenine-specific methylase
VLSGKASRHLAGVKADICFIDPPYPLEMEYEMALTALSATPAKLVIAQHATRFQLAATYGTLVQFRALRQGDNTLSFYQPSG